MLKLQLFHAACQAFKGGKQRQFVKDYAAVQAGRAVLDRLRILATMQEQLQPVAVAGCGMEEL